jgi:hypothetical protein
MFKKLLCFLFVVNICSLVKAQSFIVTGRIFDSISRQPLEAANIEEVGNENSKTISDATGRFSIKVNSATPILKASFIGYKTLLLNLQVKPM